MCLSKGDDFKLARRSRNRNWLAGKKPGLVAAGKKAFRLCRRKGRGLCQPLEEPVSCPKVGSKSGTAPLSFHSLLASSSLLTTPQPAAELCCETQISVAALITNLPRLASQGAEALWGAGGQYPPKQETTKPGIALLYSDPTISLLGSLWKDTGARGGTYKMLMSSHWKMAK